jgi:ParB family transcriptional regulator, chromosome partitioning protein
VSMPNSSNLGKRKLLKESPFQKLAQRTVDTGDEALKEARQIDISKIDTNPRQPRRNFDAAALTELAQDIQARGILQPPIVRPIGETGRFEIVVGERRYQAAKQVGLKNIPVLVRELDDQEAEITSLVENIQRENLSLSDEAGYFKMLQTKYDYSIGEIAEEVAHKSRSYVEVRLRLAEYPVVLELVEDNKLGLQEANLLLRDKAHLQENLNKLRQSLNISQSVFSKDTKLGNSQSREKTASRPASIERGQSRLTRPFLNFARELKVLARKLDRVEAPERQTLLTSIEALEKEIAALKEQLTGR